MDTIFDDEYFMKKALQEYGVNKNQVYEVWQERSNFDLLKHRVWPIPPSVIDNSIGFIKQNER